MRNTVNLHPGMHFPKTPIQDCHGRRFNGNQIIDLLDLIDFSRARIHEQMRYPHVSLVWKNTSSNNPDLVYATGYLHMRQGLAIPEGEHFDSPNAEIIPTAYLCKEDGGNVWEAPCGDVYDVSLEARTGLYAITFYSGHTVFFDPKKPVLDGSKPHNSISPREARRKNSSVVLHGDGTSNTSGSPLLKQEDAPSGLLTSLRKLVLPTASL